MVVYEKKDVLIATACEVRRFSYSPYSNYQVGAAILIEDGRIFSGVNVENASYGLVICAERTAVFKAISEGAQRISAVAVCTTNLGPPCGACLQVLREFAGDIPIWLSDRQGNVRETTLHTLLPDYFGSEYLVDM